MCLSSDPEEGALSPCFSSHTKEQPEEVKITTSSSHLRKGGGESGSRRQRTGAGLGPPCLDLDLVEEEAMEEERRMEERKRKEKEKEKGTRRKKEGQKKSRKEGRRSQKTEKQDSRGATREESEEEEQNITHPPKYSGSSGAIFSFLMSMEDQDRLCQIDSESETSFSEISQLATNITTTTATNRSPTWEKNGSSIRQGSVPVRWLKPRPHKLSGDSEWQANH